jgi:Sulfotransferase family
MFLWLRALLRRQLLQFIQRLAATEDVKAIATQMLCGLLHGRPDNAALSGKLVRPIYKELGQSQPAAQIAQHREAIIVTGRFRSGTTFLWNIFRHLDGITAYYEPFNERRWFDPHTRGSKVDQTHKHVEDYWREYTGLELLRDYYCEEWTYKNLFMDATFWAPEMQRYVELLIAQAPGRPVLQFNRIDLRLQWFRHHFPQAKIVHLYRHPRDQWCSFLLDIGCFTPHDSMAQFAAHDKFYLRSWAKDLQHHFPFLAEDRLSHPYQMFYYLWRISHHWGIHFAHYSLSFEELIQNTDQVLKDLFYFLNIKQFDLGKLRSIKAKPDIGKWKHYANDKWFKEHESICETVLEEFFTVV